MKPIVCCFAVLALVGSISSQATGPECPKLSRILEMNATLPGFAESGPYAIKSVTAAQAFVLEGGKRIKVCLANIPLKGYLSVDALAAQAPKKKGDFVLILNLSNGANPVTTGSYSPQAGYGKPFWVTAEILTSAGKAGTFFSIGANAGQAVIVNLDGKTICGTFDIQGYSGRVRGEFNMELAK